MTAILTTILTALGMLVGFALGRFHERDRDRCALGIVGCEETRLHFHVSAPGLPAVPLARRWEA